MSGTEAISPLRPDRLIWRFHKSGSDGRHTKPFDALDDSQRAVLREAAILRPDEQPVLACVLRDDSWTLLTTERLAWQQGNIRQDVALSEIADATVSRAAIHTSRNKVNVSELTVVTKQGIRYRLELEAGEPLSGFWNVLKTIARAMSAERGGSMT
jgi:hypothetical protein